MKLKIPKLKARVSEFRYGVPGDRADEMDRVFNGALEVIANAKARRAGHWGHPDPVVRKIELKQATAKPKLRSKL